MGATDQPVSLTLGVQRVVNSRTKICRCQHCSAPGVYVSAPPDSEMAQKWPRLVRPSLQGQPVGNVCPQCYHPRPKDVPQSDVASMSDWLWSTILRFKAVLIWCIRIKRKIQQGRRGN